MVKNIYFQNLSFLIAKITYLASLFIYVSLLTGRRHFSWLPDVLKCYSTTGTRLIQTYASLAKKSLTSQCMTGCQVPKYIQTEAYENEREITQRTDQQTARTFQKYFGLLGDVYTLRKVTGPYPNLQFIDLGLSSFHKLVKIT